jgi:HSP20 family molecular chaperone IbpA
MPMRKKTQKKTPEDLLKDMVNNLFANANLPPEVNAAFRHGIDNIFNGKSAPDLTPNGFVWHFSSDDMDMEEPTDPSPPPEQLLDISDLGDHLSIVMELPGLAKETLHVKSSDDDTMLALDAQVNATEYHREITLPCAIDTTELAASYRNGILELLAKKQH